jgi:hypothetical protein
MTGPEQEGGFRSVATVVLRLWSPERSRVMSLALLPETALLRRQEPYGSDSSDTVVLSRAEVPGRIREWLSATVRDPGDGSVLQISVMTPQRPVWSWSEGWRIHRRGWYRVGFGDRDAGTAGPVGPEELGRRVLAGLWRWVAPGS